MKYLLDTDTLSFILRGEGKVEEHFRAVAPSEVCTSPIVVGEIELGLARRSNRRLKRLCKRLFAILHVVAYEREAARQYGTLAAKLLDAGTPIGLEDTMIAAHALSLDLTLVTHNLKHFERVPRLRIEDWY